MKAGLYRDVSPVTLHLDDAVLTASLYCSSVQALAGAAEEALLESFLVEVFRCRLCLFASGHQSRVLTHLLQRHHVAAPRNAASSQTHPGLQVQSPYSLEDPDLEDPDLEDPDLEDPDLEDPDLEDPDLVDPDLEDPDLEDQDLSSASKAPSDEDSLGLERISFLLPMYGMLPNISPRSCDIGLGSQSHGGLHVAQTCEVSTLLEEVEDVCHDGGGHAHMLALPGNHDDQSAQSAHLMTLGLCRISAPPPTLKARSPAHSPEPPPPPPEPCPAAPRRRSTASAQRRAASHRTDRRTGTDRHLKKRRKERERGRERRKRHAASVQSRDRLHKHFASKHKASADKQKVAPPCGLEGRRAPAKRIAEGAVLQKDSRGATEGWGRCRNTHTVKSRGRRDGGEDERIDTTEEERGGGRLGDFCCSLCSRKFVSKLTLRRHMGIHQGEKPFHCPHCHYNTRLKASLVQHIRTHTGEKPFRCSQCSYASIDRSSLRRHSRTHSQEKPYRCTHCTYSSIQKKSLDLHARRHHTGESFPCQQCAYSSPDRQLLLRHVRKNHNSQHGTGHRGQRSPQPSDS